MQKKNLFFCLFAVVLLSSIAIQIPLHNRSLIFFDEGIIFNIAEDIHNGSVLFRDKPSYVLPGIFYLLALLYKIFGVSFLISRYAMAIIFSATAVLMFLLARKLMDEWLAFATAMVFVAHRVWAFPTWNSIGYATFSIFFLGIALLLLLRFVDHPRPATAFLVGLFVAIATMFKQDYGGFVGFGIFLYIVILPSLREKSVEAHDVGFSHLRALGAYVVGGVAVCLPVFAYFAFNGALDDLVQNAFLIPLNLETTREATRLIPIQPLLEQDSYVRNNWLQYAPAVTFMRLLLNWQTGTPPGFLYARTPVWGILLKLLHYLPYLASLGIAGILAKRYIKSTFSLKYSKIAAVLVFSVSLFLTQHMPFDFAHLMQMYFPVFLLVGILADTVCHRTHSRKKLFYPICAGLAIVMALYLYHTVVAVSFLVKQHSAKLEGPRANIYVSASERDSCSEAIRFIAENTSSGDPIFVLPYHSLFYFLSHRPNPTRFEGVWPVKVFADMDSEIIKALETKQVKYVVEFPQEHKGIGPYREFAPEIAEYVEAKYSVERTIGDPEKGLRIVLWKRETGKM